MDGTDGFGLGGPSLVFFLHGTIQEYQLGLRFGKATADFDSGRYLFGPTHGRLSDLCLLPNSLGPSSAYAEVNRGCKSWTCVCLIHSKLAQPPGASLRPGGAGMIAGADAEVVSGTGIDVQFGRDAGALQSQI